jgi:hypothetical protein
MSAANRLNLNVLLKKWQAILRLQDWDITIKYKRHYDMDDNKAGGVSWIKRRKIARISVLDPIDIGTGWNSEDVEATVVHELLHIQFCMIDDFSGVSADLFEQAIEATTNSLIRLDRTALNKRLK